jgi:hypothetical protein
VSSFDEPVTTADSQSEQNRIGAGMQNVRRWIDSEICDFIWTQSDVYCIDAARGRHGTDLEHALPLWLQHDSSSRSF